MTDKLKERVAEAMEEWKNLLRDGEKAVKCDESRKGHETAKVILFALEHLAASIEDRQTEKI